MLPVGKRKER
ncbi:hypothetical protein CAEBREN_30007 [Caenorhabditis brenneri]|uniref:Uncharacterized protein n=1 Tax=Caenorhabditis brenneri TaxID=135651 RepID=G0M8Q5_CAEBE|nr:hypothetical protein CAEBREN_30007 [Caenorhabditis brenneri]